MVVDGSGMVTSGSTGDITARYLQPYNEVKVQLEQIKRHAEQLEEFTALIHIDPTRVCDSGMH